MQTYQPFFVFGNPRSGTSLFRLMLNSHPRISVPPECGFVEWLYEKFGHVEFCENTYRSFCSEVFKTRKFETWGLHQEKLLKKLNERRPKNYQELVSEVYFEYARSMRKDIEIFGDKNNYYINIADKIDSIFPSCKKVFIVRDGRDVACSYLDLKKKDIDSKYKPNLSSSIPEIAKEWRKSVEIMGQWSRKGALSIRYEDLVVSPKATLIKVCEFLSIDYSDKMLCYYESNDEPAEFMEWKGRTFEPLDSSSLKKFKTELTSEQMAMFENVAGAALEYAGYELEI